jgi:hypothetical protein
VADSTSGTTSATLRSAAIRASSSAILLHGAKFRVLFDIHQEDFTHN